MQKNKTEKDLVLESFVHFCVGKGLTPTNEKIKFQREWLRKNGYQDPEIIAALELLFGEVASFPDVSMIREKIESRLDPMELAGKIFDGVRSYGRMNTEEAKQFLGDELWSVASAYGWEDLCTMPQANVQNAKAQLRDMIKIRMTKAESRLKLLAGGKQELLA